MSDSTKTELSLSTGKLSAALTELAELLDEIPDLLFSLKDSIPNLLAVKNLPARAGKIRFSLEPRKCLFDLLSALRALKRACNRINGRRHGKNATRRVIQKQG